MAACGVVLGIDLAGSVRRDTGAAVLAGKKFLHVSIVHSDEEIVSLAEKYKPLLVAIDAPLTLPQGRKTIEHNNGVHFRKCDLAMRKAGIRFFPVTLGPMRSLTKRGMRLRAMLAKKGARAIETFPGAAYDIFGVPRKDKKRIALFYRNGGFGFEGREYTQDELDAMCCALVASLVLRKKARKFGGNDGEIWVPAPFRGARRGR